MTRYYVEAHRKELSATDPGPMTAEAVEAWLEAVTNWYDPEVTEFDTLEEALAYATKQQPRSYWVRGSGKHYLLQVEFYDVLCGEVDDETGDLDYANSVARFFADAEF